MITENELRKLIEFWNKIFKTNIDSELILGIAATDSDFGQSMNYDKRIGFFNMPMQMYRNFKQYCIKNQKKNLKFLQKYCQIDKVELKDLFLNIKLDVAILILILNMFQKEEFNTLEDIAKYYKKYYDSIYGIHTEQEFIEKYNKYIKNGRFNQK